MSGVNRFLRISESADNRINKLLDKFVDEISDWNRERVFKEVPEYLRLK